MRPTKALLAGLVVVGVVASGAVSPAAATPDAPTSGTGEVAVDDRAADVYWRGTWAAAQQPVNPFVPGWSQRGFTNQSLRQVIRISVGGTHVRIRLSNLYGDTPLPVTGATIARTEAGAALQRGSQRHLTFGGRQWAQIPVGTELDSDPLLMLTTPLEQLTVTLYFARHTGRATYHSRATATSYLANGDHRVDPAATAFTGRSGSWYFLTRVDVRGDQASPPDGIVALGDSITDGYGSTPDANNRYPDELAERLVRNNTPRPVLNAGISANRVLSDSACGGEPAITRFRRNVATQPGVRTVIVLEGINDIRTQGGTTGCAQGAPVITTQQLIDGHTYLIRWARDRGFTAIGATLPPCGCGGGEETMRTQLNRWMRTTAGTANGYDAVADLDTALADPTSPRTLRPAYDSGDGLHPNNAGYRRIADTIPLTRL
ncbi:SGNH/GDSL hydrolase family protein [Saccharothrix sp. Mg75]|uniref:SGNH/GDSL hydrolase family protein n=1 Tax=Saccharothrix sp. Mg75 TaxID=3445357 RepID=UPI003EEED292